MELNFSADEERFRQEVKAFLLKKLPPALAEKVKTGAGLERANMAGWHAILNEQGWLASHWPREHGGPGWTAVQKYIFETECALAGAPRVVGFGVNMLGPVLIKFGTDSQKQYWLPRILSGDDWWCQGYSEPGAGSDLASLKMSAVLHHDPAGDYYLVNGQKTWTTLGHYANKIFCLVRTDREARPQEGISFLLIDMGSPGIDIRPIITLDGEHEVSEVFFTDVRVPAENLVGQQDKGWNCAKYLLTYERTGQAGVGLSMAALERLKRIAGSITCDGQKLLNEPLFAAQVGRIEIALESMKTTNLRIVAAVAGGGVPGVESSMLKIKGSEIRQEILSLTRKALGPRALELQMDSMNSFGHETLGIHNAANEYFNNRKLSIFGGSTEIQKNIISKILIGL